MTKGCLARFFTRSVLVHLHLKLLKSLRAVHSLSHLTSYFLSLFPKPLPYHPYLLHASVIIIWISPHFTSHVFSCYILSSIFGRNIRFVIHEPANKPNCQCEWFNSRFVFNSKNCSKRWSIQRIMMKCKFLQGIPRQAIGLSGGLGYISILESLFSSHRCSFEGDCRKPTLKNLQMKGETAVFFPLSHHTDPLEILGKAI